MAHDHHHGDMQSYYVEQLFNIGLCGFIGGIMVVMWIANRQTPPDQPSQLYVMFADNTVQYDRVLLGGIGLMAVVLLRAVYVWFAAGHKQAAHTHSHGDCGHDHGDCGHDHHHEHHHDHHHAHDHDHDHAVKAAPTAATTSLPLAAAAGPALVHDHDHGHDHDHAHDHDHGHGHDHDHGWAPWRFMLLALPIVLFLLGLPRPSSGSEEGVGLTDEDQKNVAQATQGGTDKLSVDYNMKFLTLERAALDPNSRDGFTGKTIQIDGEYRAESDHSFTLVRMKVACCGADAVPLKAGIMIHPALQSKYHLDSSKYQGKWVKVIGQLYFVYRANTREWISVVVLSPDDKAPLSKMVVDVPRPAKYYAD
jgi:hypothetical protein